MIDTNFLLPILKNKNQHELSTIGGNLLCPRCKVRVKLYKLLVRLGSPTSDGQRKCRRCGKKFGKKVITKQSYLQIVADTMIGNERPYASRGYQTVILSEAKCL
ncbi:MAG: hypothetical protein V1781_00280 [Bacteroidota bacterium]